jgi:DNA-binding HxlR family transcriptional regulator
MAEHPEHAGMAEHPEHQDAADRERSRESPLRWSDLDARVCSVARATAVLGDRWTILVLREVFNGVRRFADIQEHIGISRSVLTDRLARLTEQGVVERRPYREPGDRQRHEYRLTEMGRDLQTVLVALIGFGDRWLSGPEGPPVRLVHRDCGADVHARLVCGSGHPLEDRRAVELRPGPGAEPRPAAG